jgi:hypothetical protein
VTPTWFKSVDIRVMSKDQDENKQELSANTVATSTANENHSVG